MALMAKMNTENIDHLCDDPHNAKAWKSLAAIWHRPLWNRISIIQEVTLPPSTIRVYCGRKFVLWTTVVSATRAFQGRITPMKPVFNDNVFRAAEVFGPANGLVEITSSGWFPGKTEVVRKLQLGHALFRARGRGATDPRDKIYALLSIVSDSVTTAIIPDYSKPVRSLYKEMVKKLVDRDNLVSVLRYNGQPRRLDLPSWTPDGSTPLLEASLRPPPLSSAQSQLAQGLHASRSHHAQAVFSEDLETLTVRGVSWDTVERVNDYSSGNEHRWHKLIMQWKFQMLHDIFNEKSSPYGATFGEAFWRTIMTNISADEEYPAPSAFVQNFDSLLNKELAIEQSPLLMASAGIVHNRRFLSTGKGYIGLGPHDSKVGDVVCVLLGGETPFILRKNESFYQFVGEAYVHGIMNGEVIDCLDNNDVILQDFALR